MSFKPALKNAPLAAVLLALVMTAGCATPNYVRVLPAPDRHFPAIPPALIRLPVGMVFPSGSQVVQHVSDLFKNILRPKMDETVQIAGVHWKFNALNIWSEIQRPIYLDKGIWLLIRPQTLSLGSMRTDPKNLLTASTVLETTADPQVIFGPKPITTPIPMPPLGTYVPGPPTFQAVSDTRISYKEANAHLKDPRLKLIGMELKGTGQKLTLKGIRMYGSGGQVVVEVKLRYEPLLINLGSKPAKLTVYLKGTPHYLAKEQAFDLPDLDYDIKSSDLMVQIADMVFKADFKNQLRLIARLPIGPKLDELKAKVDKALNRPLGHFIRLSANVTSLKVLDGMADNEGIVVRVSIQGTSALDVTWN